MANKKEIKTKQQSISLFDIEWAIIEKFGKMSSCSTHSETIRRIIRDWIFLKKHEIENEEVRKKRLAFIIETGFGNENRKFENPYNEELKTLIDAYPDLKTIEEIDSAEITKYI